MSTDVKPGSEVQHAVHWFDKPKPMQLDALTQNFIGLVLLTAGEAPVIITALILRVFHKILHIDRLDSGTVRHVTLGNHGTQGTLAMVVAGGCVIPR